jgi:formyltetrahydrofolate deformylase
VDSRGSYILTLSCPDAPGIVYAVARFLAERNSTIVQSQQFGDPDAGTFFMRVQFDSLAADETTEALRTDFAQVGQQFSMSWQLRPADQKTRALIMVSRHGHCLNDLLYRASIGALNIDLVVVVSNHRDFERLSANYAVPFHYIPVSAETRVEAEAQLLELVKDLDIDLVVLARYMQVLSNQLCKELEGRAINIHHSMLPSFKGARPYHQAYAHGVKLIGATAHYVTAELDEGPIIEQEVARVDHSMTAQEVTALGRDVECQALARAVRWHTESRVLLNGQRTVVFH